MFEEHIIIFKVFLLKFNRFLMKNIAKSFIIYVTT